MHAGLNGGFVLLYHIICAARSGPCIQMQTIKYFVTDEIETEYPEGEEETAHRFWEYSKSNQ